MNRPPRRAIHPVLFGVQLLRAKSGEVCRKAHRQDCLCYQDRAPIKSCASWRGSSVGRGVGVGFCAYQEADFAEILVDFAIGLEERGFVVGDVVRAAVVADNFLDLAEFIGGHGGEKVVFDLAGEAAGAEIDAGVIFDVAAGEDLFAEEIDRGVALLQRHALVIGRENQREIQAQKGLMGDDEKNGMGEAQQVSEQAEIPAGVEDEETHFEDGMRDFVALEEANTVVFQDEGFEQGQREEREVLVFHGEAREAVLRGGLFFGKCERDQVEVGIGGDVVRRTVMVIVLVEPPAVAEAEKQIRMQQAQELIAGRAAENFLVAGVVNDETELREDEGEESGVAKFDPGIMKFGDEHEGADEHGDVEENLSDVVRGLLR